MGGRLYHQHLWRFLSTGRSKSGPEKEVDRPAGKSGFKKKKGGKMPGAPDISNVQGIKINLDKLWIVEN